MAHLEHSLEALGPLTAPPQPRRSPAGTALIVLGVLIALGAAVAFLGGGQGAGAFTGIVALAFIVAGWATGEEAREFNREKLPQLREEWDHRWICHTCGLIYSPPGSPQSPASSAPADPARVGVTQ